MTSARERGRLRGLSVIETLAALAITLIALLAVIQTFSNADLLRRIAGTRVDGLPAGLAALGRIEHELAQAGGTLLATGDSDLGAIPVEAEPGAGAGNLAIGCTATVAGRPLRIAPLTASGGGGPMSSDSLTRVGGGSPFVPAPSGSSRDRCRQAKHACRWRRPGASPPATGCGCASRMWAARRWPGRRVTWRARWCAWPSTPSAG